MTPAMKPPVMPLLTAIAATILAILASLAAYILSFGNRYTFMQLLLCMAQSMPLPIVLLAVYRKRPVENWAKSLGTFAIALLAFQGVSILTMFIGNIVFIITEEYPQWLYYLAFIPGSNLLYAMLQFFQSLRYAYGPRFWILCNLFYILLHVGINALYVLSTGLVVLDCRNAQKAQEPVDPWSCGSV